METVRQGTNTGATMCSELDKMGLLDISRCCQRCHSADDYASQGPCQATLLDGKKVFVCCQGKKQLLGEVY